MLYSIIGTGNMAWFLGQKLTAAGHQCAGIWGRDKNAAEALAHSVRNRAFDDIRSIQDAAMDVCFLAVSDSSIEEIAAELSFEKTVLAHTSGAVSIDVLKNAAKDTAVLWPVYSILKNSMPGHRNIPCAWEANTAKAAKYIQAMGHSFTDNLFEADSERRKWLHLGAVISNNFINHLMAVCQQICKEQHVPFTTLQPIIKQTIDRIAEKAPYELQTGPARRGDTHTLQNQENLLGNHPEWQAIYKTISSSIENMYKGDAGDTGMKP